MNPIKKYTENIKFIFHIFNTASKTIGRLRKLGVKRNSIILWWDLVYCRLVLGYDFDDYCTYEFWRKTRKQRSEYLSFRENTRLALKVIPQDVWNLFLDKSLWNERFKKYVFRDWIITDNLDRRMILDFIQKNKTVILKPLKDYGGAGIKKITYGDENLDELIDHILLQKNMMLEECIYNHPDLKKLAPASLNTIRIVTVIDNDGKVHIPAALLRMGSGTSLTDNYHSGGMGCPINISTGKLEKTAYGEFNTAYEIHPYSKIRFEGYEIPRFREVVAMAQKAALEIPEARYVGWDFVVTPDTIEILEGNIPPGEHITQLSSGPIRNRLYEWGLK